MTQKEIDFIIYVADCLKDATDFEIWNPLRTKEQKIEMIEYKQYLRDIHLYDYNFKQPPSFYKLTSRWKRTINKYKEEEGITIDLGIE